MTAAINPSSLIDYRALIEPTRVNSRLYHDPKIFEQELERIWYRSWVYVGHVSEVPNRNDYVTKSIGPTPVLLVHDRTGQISLLLNKCPHRGNQLCAYREGNRSTFTCPYHSWTFSNTGELAGYAAQILGVEQHALDHLMHFLARLGQACQALAASNENVDAKFVLEILICFDTPDCDV